MARMYRQCPECKGKTGFTIHYTVSGYGFEKRTFKGNVLDAERNVFDNNERFAVCLDCGKQIDTDKLDL